MELLTKDKQTNHDKTKVASTKWYVVQLTVRCMNTSKIILPVHSIQMSILDVRFLPSVAVITV